MNQSKSHFEEKEYYNSKKFFKDHKMYLCACVHVD